MAGNLLEPVFIGEGCRIGAKRPGQTVSNACEYRFLMNISQDEQERAIFRNRRKFQTDYESYESDIAAAEERGKAQPLLYGYIAFPQCVSAYNRLTYLIIWCIIIIRLQAEVAHYRAPDIRNP